MITTVIPAKLNEDKTKLELIDQTLLPNEEVFLYLDERKKIFEAIKMLRVRGAPAIGVAAAFGLYVCMNKMDTKDFEAFKKEFMENKRILSNKSANSCQSILGFRPYARPF